ncbi:hypothetical protein AG1IA_04046 [Rhizoctonia solani AG-1 IA]|uniref:Uncharacterized protein n=1 Tax=Thanatephorus cucumeris (strain AG1-IA) TaxID=983506 RepID=L8WUW5_THACA|nr:hypothetical protein AG1IA_04046 [Rhizoctonia solani AG-1 IA]
MLRSQDGGVTFQVLTQPSAPELAKIPSPIHITPVTPFAWAFLVETFLFGESTE